MQQDREVDVEEMQRRREKDTYRSCLGCLVVHVGFILLLLMMDWLNLDGVWAMGFVSTLFVVVSQVWLSKRDETSHHTMLKVIWLAATIGLMIAVLMKMTGC